MKNIENIKNITFVLLLLILAFLSGFVSRNIKNTIRIQLPDTYYLEAEVLSQENGETIFCTDKGNYSVKDKVLNPDTEYLLTMVSNGTKDPKDDEICVIWEVK